MKQKLKITGLLTICAGLFIVGCVTKNPSFNPSQPISAANPTHVADTNAIAEALSALSQANQASAPINPYSALIGLGIGIAGIIGTGVSGVYAKIKSNQAAAAQDAQTQSTAVTNQLAKSVVAQGPAVAQAVLDHASNNETLFPHVANAINLVQPPDPIKPVVT